MSKLELDSKLKQIENLLDECAVLSEETGIPFQVPRWGDVAYVPEKYVNEYKEARKNDDDDKADAMSNKLPYFVRLYDLAHLNEFGWYGDDGAWIPSMC